MPMLIPTDAEMSGQEIMDSPYKRLVLGMPGGAWTQLGEWVTQTTGGGVTDAFDFVNVYPTYPNPAETDFEVPTRYVGTQVYHALGERPFSFYYKDVDNLVDTYYSMCSCDVEDWDYCVGYFVELNGYYHLVHVSRSGEITATNNLPAVFYTSYTPS